MKKIAVIGSGSWGVALAVHMAKLGHEIKIWSFSKEEADLINNERKCKFLPDVILPSNIECTQNFEECVKDSEYIFHVTPSKVVRNTVKQYKNFMKNQPVIMCSKGFETETLNTLVEILEEEIPNNSIAVFSGPSHAEEVSRDIPTSCVVGAKSKKSALLIQDIF